VRASIERRSRDSWSVRFDLPRDSYGRRRQKRVTVRGTRREAERVASKIASELGYGSFPDGSNPRLSDFFDQWLAARELHVSVKTFDRYRSIVNLHIKPHLGSIRIQNLRALEIDYAINAWSRGHRKDKKSGQLSRTSVKHIFETLRCALNQARRWGLITNNPCANASPPRREHREAQVLDVAEVGRLFEELRADACLLPVMFDIATGLRRGELLALCWRDVELDRGLVHVRGSLESVKGQLHIKEPKTRKSRRTLALPELAVRALRAQLKEQVSRFDRLGITRSDVTPVFDRLGSFWEPASFSLRFYRLREKLKLGKLRFHDLRHSFASILLTAGVDLKIISDLLGHAEIGVTANQYLHPAPGLRRDAADRFDAEFERSGAAQWPSQSPEARVASRNDAPIALSSEL
jgi:integrase